MKRSVSVALWIACAGAPLVAEAQAVPRITVNSARMSADTIALGDRFEMSIDLSVGPGSVAFFPDSLQGPGFEPFGPAQWSVEPGADGRALLSVRYPLIAFQVGTVTVPEFDVFAADAGEARAAGLAREGAIAGSFEAFVEGVDRVPSARLRSVPSREIWVASVLLLDEVTQGVAPRPAADVAGGDRSWPATLLTLLFGLTIVAVAGVSLREWSETRSGPTEVSIRSPRSEALEQLDALVSEGLHRSGQTRDFFSRSSRIVRRYVESMEVRWGPAWTSTELMEDLAELGTSVTTPDPAPLEQEMDLAEAVKFGGRRPEVEGAEAHVTRLRGWIEKTSDVSTSEIQEQDE
jgi:hypothetical protein